MRKPSICFTPIMRILLISVFFAGIIGFMGIDNAYAHGCGVCDNWYQSLSCSELNYYIYPVGTNNADSATVTAFGSGFAQNARVRIDFGEIPGLVFCTTASDGSFETDLFIENPPIGTTYGLAHCECDSCETELLSAQEVEYFFTYAPNGPYGAPTANQWAIIALIVLLMGSTVWTMKRYRNRTNKSAWRSYEMQNSG